MNQPARAFSRPRTMSSASRVPTPRRFATRFTLLAHGEKRPRCTTPGLSLRVRQPARFTRIRSLPSAMNEWAVRYTPSRYSLSEISAGSILTSGLSSMYGTAAYPSAAKSPPYHPMREKSSSSAARNRSFREQKPSSFRVTASAVAPNSRANLRKAMCSTYRPPNSRATFLPISGAPAPACPPIVNASIFGLPVDDFYGVVKWCSSPCPPARLSAVPISNCCGRSGVADNLGADGSCASSHC